MSLTHGSCGELATSSNIVCQETLKHDWVQLSTGSVLRGRMSTRGRKGMQHAEAMRFDWRGAKRRMTCMSNNQKKKKIQARGEYVCTYAHACTHAHTHNTTQHTTRCALLTNGCSVASRAAADDADFGAERLRGVRHGAFLPKGLVDKRCCSFCGGGGGGCCVSDGNGARRTRPHARASRGGGKGTKRAHETRSNNTGA